MNEAERKKLWDDYSKTRLPELREQIILEYASLVKIVAGRLSMYLGQNVEYDDLVGYGIFGLIDAIDKFDLEKTVKFETYASLRIRGSILDQIRKMDWIPRTIRKKQKMIETAMKEVEVRNGNVATEEEIAAQLQISREDLLSWQSQLQITNLISLNEFVELGSEPVMDSNTNSHFEVPEKVVEQQELKEVLEEALQNLSEKECKVVQLYYYEELTLKEISKILEVSESRVSQLHTRALQKMKQKMGNYMNILVNK